MTSAEPVITLLSIVGAVGFGVATMLALTHMPNGTTLRARIPWMIVAAAMAIYLFVSVSNSLEHGGVTARFDDYEDYLQVLFAPLLVFAAFASESNRHAEQQQHNAHLLKRQNELLLEIIDTSPVGIMIVSPSGSVTFANDPARNILGLRDDSETGSLSPDPWTMLDTDGRPTSLRDLVRTEGVSGDRRVIHWPDGRKLQCMFRATAMADAEHSLGGAVVTVEVVG